MMERAFYFPRGDLSLFGVFHETADVRPRVPFVFCHPFGEEKLWAHRPYVSFARELARRGHPVLRFDHSGNGDSEGEFRDSTVETSVSDLKCAIATIQQLTRSPKVGLLGLRFGATLASIVADQQFDVSLLVLWEPVVDGQRYAQDLLRINLATQAAVFREIRDDRAALIQSMKQGRPVNVDGYPIGFGLYEQMTAIALAGESKRFTGPCLVVQIHRMSGARPNPELEAFARQYQAGTLEVVQEEPFWKEIQRFYEAAPNLFDVTLKWLEAR